MYFTVKNQYAVHIRSCVPKLALAKKAWPICHKYQFVDWLTLNQLQATDTVDVTGHVLEEPIQDLDAPLAKLRIELGYENMKQTVVLLGELASVECHTNDVICCSGMRLHLWNYEKTLQSTLGSVVEVNPSLRSGIKELPAIHTSSKRRKVMNFENVNPVSIAAAKQLCTNLQDSTGDTYAEFTILSSKLPKLDANFFACDAPLVGGQH